MINLFDKNIIFLVFYIYANTFRIRYKNRYKTIAKLCTSEKEPNDFLTK